MKKGKRTKVMMGLAIMAAVMASIQVSGHTIISPNEVAKDSQFIAMNKPLSIPMLNNLGNVLISSDNPDGDDLHPKIAMNAAGVPVVIYEQAINIFTKTIAVCYSGDGGNSWSKQFEFDSANWDGSGLLMNPDIIYNPNTDEFFLGACDPLGEYGEFFCWLPGDIAAATEEKYWNAFSSEEANENAATYVGEWMVWLRTDNSYSTQGLLLMYLTYDENDDTFKLPSDINSNWGLGSYYDGESILKTSPASNLEMDTGLNRMYMVMQHDNETTGRSEIAYKSTVTDLDPNSDTFLFTDGGGPGGMDKYSDIEVWPWQGYFGKGDNFDSKDPDVAASGSNVAIVYMTNDNIFGDWDIRCTYSHDDGETWETSVVTEDHPVDEVNPAVYMSGDTVFCAYIKEGNLYLVKSEDGGATWGEPERINDEDGTVVEEYRSVDINAGGIVWTDNRDGHKNIYYAPLPAAILNVGSISGGMGIKATVTNTGTEDATGVAWSIDVSGLVFVGGHTEGTVDVPAGGEATISSGLVFGIGPGTITVTVGGVTKTASCFILGPLVLGVK